MTTLDQAVKLAREAKATGALVIEEAHQNGLTHRELRQNLRMRVYDRLPDSPVWLRTQVRDYLEGYEDAVIKANTSHLYLVGGLLYGISTTPGWALAKNGQPLPSWQELPRDKWPLGEHGAIYWVYRDKAPALFFKSEDES